MKTIGKWEIIALAIPFALGFIFLFLGAALAGQVYVDVSAPPGGNGSETAPYQSIQTAQENSGDGDDVTIAQGAYYQALSFTGKSLTLTPHGEVTVTCFQPLNCGTGPSEALCPKVVPQDPEVSTPLGLSGLVWHEDEGYWVGVADNYRSLSAEGFGGYAVFGFRETADVTGKLKAFPLLSDADAQAFKPHDLEGITRLTGGDLCVMGSLSLDGKKQNPDTSWRRFLGLRFRVEGGQATGLTRLSLGYRADLREWVISNAGINWALENITSPTGGQGEGINVEGLAGTDEGNYLIGFRAPVWCDPYMNDCSPLILEAGIPDNAPPQALQKLYVLSSTAPLNFGIRGIEQIPGQGGSKYIVSLGAKATAHDPLIVGVWDMQSGGLYENMAQLPAGFVAEGVDVQSIDASGNMVLGLVDDLGAKFMKLEMNISQ